MSTPPAESPVEHSVESQPVHTAAVDPAPQDAAPAPQAEPAATGVQDQASPAEGSRVKSPRTDTARTATPPSIPAAVPSAGPQTSGTQASGSEDAASTPGDEVSVLDILGIEPPTISLRPGGQKIRGQDSARSPRSPRPGTGQNNQRSGQSRPTNRPRPVELPKRSGTADGRICLVLERDEDPKRPGELLEHRDGRLLVGTSLSMTKDSNSTFFAGYPHTGTVKEALLNALYEVLLRTRPGAIMELSVATPQMRDPANYTDEIREVLINRGITLRGQRPGELHGHPGELAATLAARGKSGPIDIQYHMYSNALTGSAGEVYVAGLLYGQGQIRTYTGAFTSLDAARLDIAELRAALWAFKHVERNSHLMLIPVHEQLSKLWESRAGTSEEAKALQRAAKPLAVDISERQVKLRQGAEKPIALLAAGTRELLARVFANQGRAAQERDFNPRTAGPATAGTQ